MTMSAKRIQGVAAVVMVGCMAVGGRLLPALQTQAEEHGLRYTYESVEGAPPWVAVGTAIGALRGLIVDILWIKVNLMKERGLYFEVKSDSEMITKLQPRFASVWAFHGHNMAYNISVATNTQEERWSWVNAGIRLVRNEGLRHNPNDLRLYRELAFWFSHKIEGYSDDAHLYYKQKFAEEWHMLLGRPPEDYEDRIAWIEMIANAPSTLSEAEDRAPGVRAIIEEYNSAMSPFGDVVPYSESPAWLQNYALWSAIKEQSEVAQMLGMEERARRDSPAFTALDEIAGDPERKEAWDTLVAYTRKRVLLDEYNMDPEIMAEYTRDLGPIDWRSGQAHALYWSRLGEKRGGAGVSHDELIYRALNNDRTQLQALQGLARSGRIIYDPFSGELPGRFPEPLFVDVIDEQFDYFYAKHYDTRGAGGEGFIGFLQNFMSSAVREAYRSGEWGRARELLARLDDRFGRGAKYLPDSKYSQPLDLFVKNQIEGEYEFQPMLAPSEAMAALRYAFRVGVGRDREDVWEQALTFVSQVVAIFKKNEYYDYKSKFGSARMGDLMKDANALRREAFTISCRIHRCR